MKYKIEISKINSIIETVEADLRLRLCPKSSLLTKMAK